VDQIITYRFESDIVDILKTKNYHVRFLGSDYEKKLENITGYGIIPTLFHNRNHNWSYTSLRNKIMKDLKPDEK
jgi:hypothetical protein